MRLYGVILGLCRIVCQGVGAPDGLFKKISGLPVSPHSSQILSGGLCCTANACCLTSMHPKNVW